jgi:hypothetical protein
MWAVFAFFLGFDFLFYFCSNLKFVQFQNFFLLFDFLFSFFRFENCSNSNFAQIRILFQTEKNKFVVSSNLKFIQILVQILIS